MEDSSDAKEYLDRRGQEFPCVSNGGVCGYFLVDRNPKNKR
jgi:hypothetical protein